MTETCLDMALRINKGRLREEEVIDAFDREQKIRQQFIDKGLTDNLDARVARKIVREVTDKKYKAAQRRRDAAHNILIRARLDPRLEALKAQGLKPAKAFTAIYEGTQLGVEGGRVSVSRDIYAYEARFLGEPFAQIQREKPHIIDLLRNRAMDDDVTDELFEFREGGKPGKTGNSDAKYLAKVLATAMEDSRTTTNSHGGVTGKLEGYQGPQVHDDIALLQAGEDKWITDITTQKIYDFERSFPDVTSDTELRGILSEIYKSIVTGISGKESAALRGERIGPANLATRLGQHRVLHFMDAAAAKKYRDMYGRGSTIGNIIAHQRNMARAAAVMKTFGSNPEVISKSILARETQKLRSQIGSDPKKNAKINKQIADLHPDKFQGKIDSMTGYSSVPVNVRSSKINTDIRASMHMSTLGASLLPSIPGDTATAAVASFFRGGGFWNGLFNTFGKTIENLSSAEAKEISYLYGEAFDGLTGHIASAAIANDGTPGMISKWAQTFFKINGLTKWTDAVRGSSARVIGAHLGLNIGKDFSKLHWKLQRVLKMNGINETKWDIIRQTGYREANGNHYVMPDRIRNLTDEQVAPLGGKTPDEARHSLEIDLRGYIADETSYAVIEVDPSTRRMTTLGYRPGTLPGEAIRYLMQFKGFPAAFTQRVIGRTVMGAPGKNMGERILNNAPHIGVMITSMTVAGYMSQVMKDSAKGIWPPRDPFSWATLGSAMVAGGGLGIYGDFLFGQAANYGMDPLIKAAGPGVGVLSDIAKIYYAARSGDPKAAQMLRLVIDNTPYANLFYARPALDILFLNSMREAASPGYLRRQEQTRRRDYGQHYILPRTLHELTH